MFRRALVSATKRRAPLVPARWSSSGGEDVERDSMDFDVLIVGGGPAGLSCAIRLKQLAKAQNRDLSVCLIEKGSSVGDHILSGAVLEPTALNEFLPDWRSDADCPIKVPVSTDKMLYLTKSAAIPCPPIPSMNNHGNYVISLGAACQWLSNVAEAHEVEVYPGFAGATPIIEDGRLCGVITSDAGIDKQGNRKPTFQPGMALRAKTTVIAEGCRGSLSKQLQKEFQLREKAGCDVPKFGIGFKEVWEVPAGTAKAGTVVHTAGWPLPNDTYGGSYLYHMDDSHIAIGMVVTLGYSNPHRFPYMDFQTMKHHPYFRQHIDPAKGAKCISYGARTLYEGGASALPMMNFPGGVLVGDSAGTLNLPKIKGIHTAMKSGTVAAESIIATGGEDYNERFRSCWAFDELWKVRNYYQSFGTPLGMVGGMAYVGVSEYLVKGREPWTLKHHGPDHTSLYELSDPRAKKIDYMKPDGKLSFDRLTNLARTNVNHESNQPCHLRLKDKDVPQQINLAKYGGPESKYCPAGVYEFVDGQLQINAQNCIHCKACDIKDPTQNINWTTPEGGGGPGYSAAM
eukprot:TRINITY_DN20998_c0_g1_i1.p1 TRINITY_DN20998_c0_g1~~TRINITY_DN20998_c0_g1_i1.p1  ORF type:complete len:570 (+),score=141.58 TRINITY_DN20998_c0_g1_i1:88-1797(+)